MEQVVVVLVLYHLMEYCLLEVHVILFSLLCGILRCSISLRHRCFTVASPQGKDIPAAVLCCEVDEMKEPILLSLTGHVQGLSIHYTVIDSPDDEQ